MSRGWSAPPLPEELDLLDELAVGTEPSVEGAWWITLQVVQHLLEGATTRDPRTLGPQPGALTDTLDRLVLRDIHPRPLPLDELALAARLVQRPLTRVLEQPNTQVQREHLMQPAHALREVDARSMAWLAQRPGRTPREKLGSRARALGVVRRLTPDTLENRVVRRLTSKLAERLRARLSSLERFGANDELVEQLQELERSCTSRLRQSDLAAVPPAPSPQPNNVLLDHPDYARLWRAWTLLADQEERLATRWRTAVEEYRQLLLWMLWARLLHRTQGAILEEVVLCDPGAGLPPALGEGEAPMIWVPSNGGPDGRIRRLLEKDGRLFGFIENEEGADHYFNPHELGRGVRWTDMREGQEVSFRLAKRRGGRTVATTVLPWAPSAWVLQLGLDANQLEVRRHLVRGEGLVEPSLPEVQRFDLSADRQAAIAVGRGIPWLVRAFSEGHSQWEGYADARGAVDLTGWLAHRTLERIPPTAGSYGWVPKPDTAAVLGIDWCGTRWLVYDEDVSRPIRARTLVHRFQQAAGGVEWLTGHEDRVFRPENLSVDHVSLDSTLITEGEDSHTVAIGRMIADLAAEFEHKPNHGVAWTVPDDVDELSQRAMRGALASHFRPALPVWRSVAAALSWQSSLDEKTSLRDGDVFLVVDAEGTSLCTTFLVARRDPRLQRERPSTRGIYWERRPAIPPDEHSTGLSARGVLASYTEHLLNRALGGARLSGSTRNCLRDYLIDTGTIEDLLEPGGVAWLPVDERWVVLRHDARALRRAVAGWRIALTTAIQDWSQEGVLKDQLQELPNRGRVVVLLVGRPFTHWARPSEVKRAVRRLLGDYAFEAVDTAAGDLAKGAWEARERTRLGLPAWTDWLPDLYLDVVQDGLYDDLQLVEGREVEATLGKKTSISAEKTLVLPKGKRRYAFPLESGRRTRRPLRHDVSLESRAFPLERDLQVRLELSYTFGIEDAWELSVVPVDADDAPFASLSATWTSGPTRGGADDVGPIPPFAKRKKASIQERADARREIRGVARRFNRAHGTMDWSDDSQVDELAESLRRLRRAAYGVGQSRKGLPTDVEEVEHFVSAVVTLAGTDPAHCGRSQQRLVEGCLVWLSCLGTECPEAVPPLLASHLERALRTRKDLDCLSGHVDATGRLLAAIEGSVLEQLLWRVLDELAPWDSPRFFLRALAAWRRVAWARETFVHRFCEARPDAVPRLLTIVERQLRYLLYRVSGLTESPGKRQWFYLLPFEVACMVILALLRLRGTDLGSGLERGRPRMVDLARTIRRLDGMLCRLGCRLESQQLRLEVRKPRALRRMSDLAWVVSSHLSGTEDVGLVRIDGVDS